MLYAYLLENTKRIYEINNRPLFELIRDCHLKDERIFIDSMGADRTEFKELQSIIAGGDTLMVRSIMDIADTPIDIVNLLEWFGSRGIEIVSTHEPDYDYAKNYNLVTDIMGMSAELTEKKRRLGIDKAKLEGRMGRKSNKEIKERVLRLKAADFPRDEIMKLCGISYSTYYRMIKN